MTSAFTRIDPELLPILEELRRREPIFHNPVFGMTTAEFERSTAPDYWEVGASGRRYSREFILTELTKSVPYIDAAMAGWQTTDFGLRRLGPDTYLLTYTLDQAGRRTRRSTIWQSSETGWRILYHQGTIIAAEEDDSLQAPELPISASPKFKRDQYGILIAKAVGPPITSEKVKEESEDDLG